MQPYSKNLARIYESKWGGFAAWVAPLILDFYASTPAGRKNKSVLDLCCGTGQLALHFLEKGYKVVGLDLSGHMLECARERAQGYMESGQAKFVQGDAANFKLEERFGLIVSTFDALNHLEDERALKNCFACARDVGDGYFIFDLNTRLGLLRWNSFELDDSRLDALILNRGFYDGKSEKAWTRITGFLRTGNNLFERVDENIFNTAFDLGRVKNALLEVGWNEPYFARLADLRTPIAEPEKEGRVFVIAKA